MNHEEISIAIYDIVVVQCDPNFTFYVVEFDANAHQNCDRSKLIVPCERRMFDEGGRSGSVVACTHLR